MSVPLLYSSFNVWKPEQPSNSSDDLAAELDRLGQLPESTLLLRRLPVNADLASTQLWNAIAEYQPSWVVLGGMAEGRSRLNLERRAVCGNLTCSTPANLRSLAAGLSQTDVSYHAGHFVCNATYFQILTDIEAAGRSTRAIFLHVPPRNTPNWAAIRQDAATLLTRMVRDMPSEVESDETPLRRSLVA